MKYYMIVHKLTGNHMPQTKGGQTFIQFETNMYVNCPPRLWRRLGDAKGWLTNYCKGARIKKFIDTEFGTEFDGYEFDKSFARNRADYKIIEVQLSSNGIEL